MVPTKQQFLSDVLLGAESIVEDNWDPWCHLSPDPDFWRSRGAAWLEIYITYWDRFAETFEMLADDASRDILYALMLYRVLGYRHIKLPLNTAAFWDIQRRSEAAVIEKSVARSWTIDLHRLRWNDIEYVGHPGGFHCLVGLQQYQLQRGITIRPEPGDTVLDLGGCWGDSGLVFADLVGADGKVFVFEFVESSVAIAKDNFAANPRLEPRIELVRHPVSNRTGEVLYYTDRGPATVVMTDPAGATGEGKTVTVDDFVALKELDRVDFIKMDIEGAEDLALEGAAETIRRWKPKLAISAYHRPDDMFNLPQRIRSIRPDYQLYLDIYTLYDQEFVIYAT